MSLAEGTAARVAYKFYASGAITANALDDISTLPGGTTGGQILRRVSCSVTMKKNTYASAEIRDDRQIADFRHGTRHVEGSVIGELSPSTYFDFIEAVHRDTRVGSLVILPATLTSVTASNSGSNFVFGGGDPVAAGLMVGDVVAFTGMTEPADEAVRFVITSFGGTNNRTMNVTPAPTDMPAADTTFTLTRPGHTTMVPAAIGVVPRKMLLEVYQSDVHLARVFLENRLSMYKFTMPASGQVTCEFGVYGRTARTLVSAAAPYFVAPTAVTSTGVTTAAGGTLLVNGLPIGVVTSLDMTMTLTPTTADVVGQDFAAEIFLGTEALTGNISAFVEDSTLLNGFDNETEMQVLLKVTSNTAVDSPMITLFLPRIKLGTADINWTGTGGQTIASSFQALKYQGAAPGVPQTTIRVCDTEA